MAIKALLEHDEMMGSNLGAKEELAWNVNNAIVMATMRNTVGKNKWKTMYVSFVSA